MNKSAPMIDELITGFNNLLAQIMDYLPKIVMAVLLLAAGWLLARLVRLLLVRAITHLDQMWMRLISKRGLVHLQSRQPPTRIVGELAFWLIILIFVSLATEVLGLDIFGAWLKQIINYLPLAIAGLLIVLAGFVVSSLVRDLVTSTAGTAGLSHGDLLGRISQIIILFTAIVLGIDQIGIDIMFLSIIAGVVLATMLGGIALAFGLGARTHVSNIIAANQLRQHYHVGDKVRIGDVEGRVSDITVTRVIIETESGSVDVPARIFDEQMTVIIEKGS